MDYHKPRKKTTQKKKKRLRTKLLIIFEIGCQGNIGIQLTSGAEESICTLGWYNEKQTVEGIQGRPQLLQSLLGPDFSSVPIILMQLL